MNILIVDEVNNQMVIAKASYNSDEKLWIGKLIINEEEKDELTITGTTQRDVVQDFRDKVEILVSETLNSKKPFKGSFKRTKVEKPKLRK